MQGWRGATTRIASPCFASGLRVGARLDRDPAWASRRQHARNDLPAMTPVNAEVRVRSEEHGVVQRLSHADEASVGEAHRYVCIFLQQLEHSIHVVGKAVLAHEGASAQQAGDACSPLAPE